MIFHYKARTSERPHVLEGEFLARYNFALQFTKGREVLDVGTGLGGGAHYIALNGAKRVLGIDYSKSAIAYAKKNFSLPNLEFMVMNAIERSLPTDSFDIVFAFEVIEHLLPACYTDSLKNIARMLRIGGIFLVSTPNKLISSPDRLKPYNPYHAKEFKPEEFTNLLREHFSKVSLMGIRCINQEYLEQQKNIQRVFKYHIASFLGQYRIVRELLAFIPSGLKRKVTSEDRLPDLKASDFEISNDKVKDCEGLIAVCRR